MSERTKSPPSMRGDLVIRPVGPSEYVVKSPGDGSYFRIGEQEHFLLTGLDGKRRRGELCEAFHDRFGETIDKDDVDDFVSSARSRNLIEPEDDPAHQPDEKEKSFVGSRLPGKGSILFYRLPLCRPDRFFTWLEPKIRFVWTPAFVVATLMMIAAAAVVMIGGRQSLLSAFPAALRWETLVVVWGALILATCLHECGHGLTCKHFGGEVPDAGALLMFFIPCFYCNVSDAWLIREKSRRVWITLAGAYSDLCVWALAVFVWRITTLDSLVNYVAFVVLSVCGARTLLNLNPFLRLDGYYLLSDGLGVPNLRATAQDYWMAHVRWMLWGAERPEPVHNGRWLIAYGILIWVVALILLDFVLFSMFDLLGGGSMWFGWIMTVLLLTFAMKRVFKGFFTSEFANMLKTRRTRILIWTGLLIGLPVLVGLIPVGRSAGGQFAIRSAARVEVHSEVEGFLKTIRIEEGDRVAAGDVIAELKSPTLESGITQKAAEIDEVSATLAALEIGARPEVVVEQREQVRRAVVWQTLAVEELDRANIELKQELLRLELEIEQHKIELAYAKSSLERSKRLYEQRALAGVQYRAEQLKVTLAESKLKQVESKRESRVTTGVRAAEAELTKRNQQLASSKAALALLEAGSRPEEIDAAKAKLARLREELKFLNDERTKLAIRAPISGVVSTPRMHEKSGQMIPKGGLVCTIENVSTANIEITVLEEDVVGLEAGQRVRLKARSLPFETAEAEVRRVSPTIAATAAVAPGQPPASTPPTFTVYCRIPNDDGRLKAGMTGFAKILRDRKPLGNVVVGKVLKYVRTEFWW